VHGDGSQTRDFTFVGSVVRVLAEAVQRSVTAPGPVNLAFGGRASLLELAGSLGEVIGHPLALSHGPARAGDVHDSQADQGRLRGLFPDVEPVALSEGLRATVEWFRGLGGAAAAPST
jgi:UDP-glucose 4-epimerase